MILVAGGTGRLGSLVVAGLTGLGEPVRVLTRDAKRAEPLGPLVDRASRQPTGDGAEAHRAGAGTAYARLARLDANP